MDSSAAGESREAEVLQSLTALRQRITQAELVAGRAPHSVTMVAVTKGFPASDLVHLERLGLHEIAENRDQEARSKIPADCSLRVHFIGQLQTNKARSVVRYADVVQSVHRVEVASALAQATERAERRIEVFLQVNLDPVPVLGRGGAMPEEILHLADAVSKLPTLELRGVMAVAPNGLAPDPAFERLASISAALTARFPEANSISAGMSGDFESAIRYGATHVRVGSALLGHRRVPIR